MFQLENVTAKCNSVTNIAEKHGPDRVPAVSIGLTVTGGLELLAMFDPRLTQFLLQKPVVRPEELPLDHDGLTELRFPLLGALSWSKEGSGYILKFIIGASGNEDVWLRDVDVKDFKIQPLEGGSVRVSFKAHAQPANEAEHGRIARLLQREYTITLEAPQAEPDLIDAIQDFRETKPKRGRKNDGDPFAGSDLAGAA